MERQGIIAKVFPGIFLPFSLLPARKISPQHQTSTALLGLIWENRAKPPPPSFPAALPHIHSKTACRGFKSFCPCHKTGENTGFSPVFFLHVLYGYCVHAGSDSGLPLPFAPVLILFHPFQHPKHTRLRRFSPEIGCVSLFFPLLDVRNLGARFCALCRYASQIKAIGDTM